MNKRVQINSFCGGTSKLVDSSFLGFEESINMYPETVESEDSYTKKMLKSIEGFRRFGYTPKPVDKFFVSSKSSASGRSHGEPVLYYVENSKLWRKHEDGYEQVAAVLKPLGSAAPYEAKLVGDIEFVETSGDPSFLVFCGYFFVNFYKGEYHHYVFCFDLDSPENEIVDIVPLELPDAFDHGGNINPTKIAFLNYRLIVNDEGHDYIYWSELNKPNGVDDVHAFQQKLTRYTFTKNDGTQVTAADNQYYPPAYGTYREDSLRTEEVWMAALNNVKVDFRADNVQNLVALDQSFIAFGTTSFQVFRWQNSQYAPYVTSYKTSSVGLVSPEACAVINGSVFFLGSGAVGTPGVYVAGENGFEKVSTISVDQRLASVNEKNKSYAFSYSYKGHSFFVLTFTGDDDNFTLCYDLTEGVWHTRASMDDDGNINYWSPRYAINAFGNVLFSDTRGSGFYVFDKDSFVDPNGRPIPRIRTTGIKFDMMNDLIVRNLELITDNGAGKDLDVEPRVMLQVSKDGGFTWSNEKWVKSGKVGQRNFRTLWNDLGKGARIAFRVKVTDPVPFNIATAMLEYSPLKNRIF